NPKSDDINLTDLLRAILRTRVAVVSALLLVTALFWTVIVTTNRITTTTSTYSLNIYLTFEGATQGHYPNETEYRPYDIIAPVILNGVYDKSPLANYIERDEFISGFTVIPYIPDQNLIRSKYNLETKGLSQAEIENLQQQLKDELNQSATTAATITFTTIKDDIPKNALNDAMRNIPEAWAEHMVANVGVMNYETTVYSSAVVDTGLVDQMDYLIAFEILLEKIRLLRSNIAAIEELPNGRIVRDDETGLSAPDLERAVFDMEQYQIKPLVTPIRNLGLAKNNEVVNLYFEDQVKELERSRQLAEKKKQNLADAYSTYVNNQIETDGTRPAIATQGNVIPQFGTEFLDRIVDLTNAGLDLQFRQDLTNKQVDLSNELSDVESEITRVSEIMAALKTSSNDKDSKLVAYYEAQTRDGLPTIVSKLIGYFDISTRLYKRVSLESLGLQSSMFRFVDSDVQTSTPRAILNTNNIGMYAIVLFLTIVVVVPVVMMRNALMDDHPTPDQALLPPAD
ncbi:MAG: hypothetical protein AAF525_19235, partial [Pseudomonadota bacterium]